MKTLWQTTKKRQGVKTVTRTVNELIKNNDCPLPLEIFPNDMGINLVSVDNIEWDELDDGQIQSLTIKFIPKVTK